MAMDLGAKSQNADALDQKGNIYFRRKLLRREFLGEDLIRLTFELPQGVSLSSLGFDPGLGDFVRIRPHAAEHMQFVENPTGGRAYSPVFPPEIEGKFGVIVKPYGPEGKIVGMSSLLKSAAINSEFLITSHVEHTFWKERDRGYYCNKRNVELGSDGCYFIGLIAFGIGITEIAPVAMSELRDPRVKRVTILWANKHWSDAEWALKAGSNTDTDDLVHDFFASQGKYGNRLQVKHILSREKRPEACFQGRISEDVIRKAFLSDGFQAANMKFLTVGTTKMIDDAYKLLGDVGLDVVKGESWGGSNLLYRKLDGSASSADRLPSPLLADAKGNCKRAPTAHDEEPCSKKSKVEDPERA